MSKIKINKSKYDRSRSLFECTLFSRSIFDQMHVYASMLSDQVWLLCKAFIARSHIVLKHIFDKKTQRSLFNIQWLKTKWQLAATFKQDSYCLLEWSMEITYFIQRQPKYLYSNTSIISSNLKEQIFIYLEISSSWYENDPFL